MAAVPTLGRATEVEGAVAPEADLTRALYERHAGQIYSFCLHRLGSREEAEDAVQTTFLNAFRGLRRGVVPESESAWLFKIAENVCLTRHRSTWRRGRVEALSDMQALQDVTPARERNGDELIPLGEALAAMPETQQRAILLREWQGLSYREIADEMGMSQSAVETLIFRARRSLANALEEPWAERRARRAGRRAFDLGSLLAGLKGLLGGGAAAKVAVVAVAAVMGTAVVAVAERRAASPSPRAVESSAPAQRSALPRPSLAFVAPAEDAQIRAVEQRDLRKRAAARAWGSGALTGSSVSPAGAARATGPNEPKPGAKQPPAPAQSQDPETSPAQAEEPDAQAEAPAPAADTQVAPARAKPKPRPRAHPRAEQARSERPSPERPQPKAEHPQPPPHPAPPAASPPANPAPEEKDKAPKDK